MVQISSNQTGNERFTQAKARVNRYCFSPSRDWVCRKHMNIKPCQGCLVCRKTGHCVMQDDFQNMFKDIIDADVVVFGSPVYLWQITAQMKLLWDRLCGLFNENHKPRYAAKSLIMVYSQGNPNAQAFQTSFQTNEAMLKIFGLNVVNTILLTGGGDPNTAANNKEVLLKAYEAGKTI